MKPCCGISDIKGANTGPMKNEIIRTSGLTKQFEASKAVDDLSLHVNEGEVYGFLGLNGAGKTTTIRMLLGMIKPSQGEIFLFGKPLKAGFEHWNDVGYLVETPYSYPNLSVFENLKVIQKLRGLRGDGVIEEVIDHLKLHKYRDAKANTLSLGNQQRLGLARALIHRPKLLILDEPINGLDPEGIVEVRELLVGLARQGSTIFLSSHILGEISRIANRIGIIHSGKLVKELSTDQLSHEIIKKLIIDTNDNEKALLVLHRAGYLAKLTENMEISINESGALDKPELVSALLAENQLPPKQIYQYTEDLEMYFLRTIKDNAR